MEEDGRVREEGGSQGISEHPPGFYYPTHIHGRPPPGFEAFDEMRGRRSSVRIEPLIENIVGSKSSDGIYNHFPSSASAPGSLTLLDGGSPCLLSQTPVPLAEPLRTRISNQPKAPSPPPPRPSYSQIAKSAPPVGPTRTSPPSSSSSASSSPATKSPVVKVRNGSLWGPQVTLIGKENSKGLSPKKRPPKPPPAPPPLPPPDEKKKKRELVQGTSKVKNGTQLTQLTLNEPDEEENSLPHQPLDNDSRRGKKEKKDKRRPLKEKPKSRREGRGIVEAGIARLLLILSSLGRRMLVAGWWFLSLVTDVTALSMNLAVTLGNEGYSWCRNVCAPTVSRCGRRLLGLLKFNWWRKKEKKWVPEKKGPSELLSLLGPERNILLPGSGEEALKRLLSLKGEDPYSVLGVRSDSSEELIRRYYKRQAVLVHPDKNEVGGAEEAFKILQAAFELVGDPGRRAKYHEDLAAAAAHERIFGDLGDLLQQLRAKMEAVSNTIRCTKCNSRHKKNRTDRPLFAARFCVQCKIHHGAREGDLWAERGGLLGLSWVYYACMDSAVWEINEWARCQKSSLAHLKSDSHNVMYRLVAGASAPHDEPPPDDPKPKPRKKTKSKRK